MNTAIASQKQNFATAAEFISAVVRHGVGGAVDPRLTMQAAISGASESGADVGGFLIPTEFAERLWSRTYLQSEILRRCERIPVTHGDSIKLPAISENSRKDGARHGIALRFLREGEAFPVSKPNLRQIELKLRKLGGLGYVTDELINDAPALVAWLERAFSVEAAFVIEGQALFGTGASFPLGILNSNAVIVVEPEVGQAPGTVTPENLLSMISRLWASSHTGAVWLLSTDVFSQLADKSFTNGQPAVVYSPDGRRSILSAPVLLSEHTGVVGEVGDIVLADFSQYALAEKTPKFLSSIHVRFLADESIFRFSWRADGAPLWASPITPKNSALPQSPFITLASRT